LNPQFTVEARDGAARAGLLLTTHGSLETPAFMPVGTYGAVKAMSPDELEALGRKSCWAIPSISRCAPAWKSALHEHGLHGLWAGIDPLPIPVVSGVQSGDAQDQRGGVRFRHP
jgi:queuine tRNA-ribosyltransferase